MNIAEFFEVSDEFDSEHELHPNSSKVCDVLNGVYLKELEQALSYTATCLYEYGGAKTYSSALRQAMVLCIVVALGGHGTKEDLIKYTMVVLDTYQGLTAECSSRDVRAGLSK